MGRQWLLAKRSITSLKKSKATSKIVREISIAVRHGGGDPDHNPRLSTILDKARSESISKDVIQRAIAKGASSGTHEKIAMDHLVFEGYTPHKVPVIIESYTDNRNRTLPEIRLLFRAGQLGEPGSNKFLFDHVGIVEAYYSQKTEYDPEEIGIEAGANEVDIITSHQNDEIPAESTGVRFITGRTTTGQVAQWLKKNAWHVITTELGYIPRQYILLSDEQRVVVGEFLQALEEHDDVHRIWAAIK